MSEVPLYMVAILSAIRSKHTFLSFEQLPWFPTHHFTPSREPPPPPPFRTTAPSSTTRRGLL